MTDEQMKVMAMQSCHVNTSKNHDIKMCCGTTCNKAKNEQYIEALERIAKKLIKARASGANITTLGIMINELDFVVNGRVV